MILGKIPLCSVRNSNIQKTFSEIKKGHKRLGSEQSSTIINASKEYYNDLKLAKCDCFKLFTRLYLTFNITLFIIVLIEVVWEAP